VPALRSRPTSKAPSELSSVRATRPQRVKGKPSRTAEVRRDNGWFGGADKAPSIPLDADVISEEDLSIYTAALTRNGFFGPDSWYMNAAANIAYTAQATNGGKLRLPVLFCTAPATTPVKRSTPALRNQCVSTAPT
jgi:hypothetical protein